MMKKLNYKKSPIIFYRAFLYAFLLITICTLENFCTIVNAAPDNN